MKKSDPDKSWLPEPDPVNKSWHRLFLFWESYDKEYTLLKEWHNDTAQIRRPGPGPERSTGNVLYDSFLDTWGKGNLEDATVPLKDKSYFAALATASVEPKAECLIVLKAILKTDANGDVILPPELKVPDQEANAQAQIRLDQLAKTYRDEYDVLDNKIDPCVVNAVGNSNDPYLQALLRMMHIETRCFERQAYFLETGKLLNAAP